MLVVAQEAKTPENGVESVQPGGDVAAQSLRVYGYERTDLPHDYRDDEITG